MCADSLESIQYTYTPYFNDDCGDRRKQYSLFEFLNMAHAVMGCHSLLRQRNSTIVIN